MNKFFKAFIAVMAFIGTAISTLLVLDKIANKNRIKGDYLECETEDDIEIEYQEEPEEIQ